MPFRRSSSVVEHLPSAPSPVVSPRVEQQERNAGLNDRDTGLIVEGLWFESRERRFAFC